jgi:hypothetical protein
MFFKLVDFSFVIPIGSHLWPHEMHEHSLLASPSLSSGAALESSKNAAVGGIGGEIAQSV